MQPRLLIHIGYQKTGSTWLQRELFNTASDVFVPLSADDSPKAAKYLGKYFIRDAEKYPLSPFDLNQAAIRKALESVSGKLDIGDRIPVISDERLSGNPHSGGFDAKIIADRIKASVPDARIFCVIREQKAIILSSYFQYLVAGGTDRLSTYLSRSYDGKRPGFSPASFRYVDLVSYYYQLFTPENVLVLPYEMFSEHTELFLKRLGDFVSVNITGLSEKVEVFHNKRTDSTLIPRFPFLNLFLKKSSVNCYSRLYIPFSRNLLRAASRIIFTDNESYLDSLQQQVSEIIKDRYMENNKELSEIINIDLSEYGYHL